MTNNRIALLLIIFALMVSGCDNGNAQNLPDQKYDVYLFIGQSNMAGRGVMVKGDTDQIDGVWILNDKDEIVSAAAPLNFYSTVRKGEKLQGINPTFSCCKALAAKSERPILLVVNARGATTLSMWQKDAPQRSYSKTEGDDEWKYGQPIPSLYDEAVRRCKIAMQHGDLKAILWHQGEGNSGAETVKSYMSGLSTFVSDLRADLGIADVPFIAGEIAYVYQNAGNFNPVIRTIGDSIPNAYWVSAEGCTTNSDNVHFSRAGQILIGERYAEKVFEIYKQ